MNAENHNDKVSFIWRIANLLRGPYAPDKYKDVVLPMVVLRRFDCLLEPTKDAVLKRAQSVDIEEILNASAGYPFSNKSKFTFKTLLNDSANIKSNFNEYLNGFSSNVRVIMEHFDFDREVKKLDDNNLLYLVVKEFAAVDFGPEAVSNHGMGYVFEELIRRFMADAEAGDHYTSRDLVHLSVNLLFAGQDDELTKEGAIITVGDFACGTGGMLSVARERIMDMNPSAQVELYGQEINPQSHAICMADILIKGENPKNIAFGSSLSADGHENLKVRYGIMNPPFGVSWDADKDAVLSESTRLGFDGRFGAGTPRVSDGSLLFLQHMISKMKDDAQGSRIAIFFNGSPLFTGDAGSGESEIRRWIIENDLLEGIVALPNDMFYNTGISTYIWVLSNRKNDNILKGPVRSGKIQLLDATGFSKKMRKSLGSKRNEFTQDHIDEITRIYDAFEENEYCKIFDNEEFGYLKITVERPLRLNFSITDERMDNLYSESAFANLYDETKLEELELEEEKGTLKDKGKKDLAKLREGAALQARIIMALRAHTSDRVFKNRDDFAKVLDEALKGIDLSATLKKSVLMGLSERDETADYCKKAGNKEPDPQLRDTETITLSVKVARFDQDTAAHIKNEQQNIAAYMEKEVAPHVPEFWIDHSKSKIGYEIPFTRYFYKYEALRPFTDIMAEIAALEKEIQEDLKAVMGE
ncbi:MAG: N-6 DNA methylase [Acidaminobacter sp.]|uniref:type I restriction-modification system subunit M n=1 Tax=Acidaminobacter sp. TaxID=1872102 RepID=UPI00137F91CE|nr:class I SAM-dependent DNA methyltransferase [Acidaminobacter sp.]MZQ99608.1 N-6 DNA methylase [Acidaminobacter sp.]